MPLKNLARGERVALVALAALAVLLALAFGLRDYLEEQRHAAIEAARAQHSVVVTLGETLVLDSVEDEKGIAEDPSFQAKFGFRGTMEITLAETEVISKEDSYAQGWIDRNYDGYLVLTVKLLNVDAFEESGAYDKEYRFNVSGICGINSSEVGIMPDLAFFSGTPDDASDKEGYAFDLAPGEEAELILAFGFTEEELAPGAEVYLDLGMDGGARHKYRIDTGLSTSSFVEGLSS